MRMVLRWSTALLIFLGVAFFPACATIGSAPAVPLDQKTTISELKSPQKAQRPAFGKIKESRAVAILEKKIVRTRGTQLLVSKRILLQLLKEHRSSVLESMRLSAQLDALKKVDLNDGSHPTD